MRLNTRPRNRNRTHEGGMAAPKIAPAAQLERLVMNCLLWEDSFYEAGDSIAKQIADLVPLVHGVELCAAIDMARNQHMLRHVPLLLVAEMSRDSRHNEYLRKAVSLAIRRPDEVGELISLCWRHGRETLRKQMLIGLRDVFKTFDEYQVRKYATRKAAITLRDAMRIVHPKAPAGLEAVYAAVIDGTVRAPDTWESRLSSGEDRREAWTELLIEEKLGFMALLMNLRNMDQAGVEYGLVAQSLRNHKGYRLAFPYRFMAAAQQAPAYASVLDEVLLKAMAGQQKLEGSTAVVVDVSGSMRYPLSRRSVMSRMEAAACLSAQVREVCEPCRVYTFSNGLVEVPGIRGLGLAHQIPRSQQNGGTWLSKSLSLLAAAGPEFDRVIVITDEQSHDGLFPAWAPKSYLINVASYDPALDVSQGWTRVSGFSQRIVDWIRASE